MNKLTLTALGIALAFSVGCSSAPPKKGPSAQGAPVPLASPEVIAAVLAAEEQAERARAAKGLTLPDEITIPGIYRPMMMNGKQVLIRETDPKRIYTTGTIRLAPQETGDFGAGLVMQPALIGSELATEVVKVKQAQASADAISADMLRRAEQLHSTTQDLQRSNAELLTRLVEVTAYAKRLESEAAGNSGRVSAP
jgi:uncharacterized protein (DUF2062 family)